MCVCVRAASLRGARRNLVIPLGSLCLVRIAADAPRRSMQQSPPTRRRRRPRCAWFLAAHTGNLNALERHLAHGQKVDQRGDWGRTALWRAAAMNHVPCIRLLLEHGADANVRDWRDGSTPLHAASYRGQFDAVRVLVAEGNADVALPNQNGGTAYRLARTPIGPVCTAGLEPAIPSLRPIRGPHVRAPSWTVSDVREECLHGVPR